MSDEAFAQKIQELEPVRADRLLEKAALKWMEKLSSGPDSLSHRMGFDAALFNKEFVTVTNKPLLSLKGLHDSLPVDVLRKPDEVDWNLALVQLKTNFSQDLTDKESPVHGRVTPIFKFVAHKASKAPKKGEPSAPRIQGTGDQEDPHPKVILENVILYEHVLCTNP